MLPLIADRNLPIGAKSAGDASHAEISLIKAEAEVLASPCCESLLALSCCLEAASAFSDPTDKRFFTGFLETAFTEQALKAVPANGHSPVPGNRAYAEKQTGALDYLRAVRWLSRQLSPKVPLTPESILDSHSRCISGKGHHQSGISYRGLSASDPGKAFEPLSGIAADEEVYPQIIELCGFINKSLYSPITQATIARFAFEALSPFNEQSESTARLLLHAVLHRQGVTRRIVAPISLLEHCYPHHHDRLAPVIAVDTGTMTNGGGCVRTACLNAWVSYYAGSVEMAANTISGLQDVVETLVMNWRKRLGHISRNSLMEEILVLIPANPLLTTELLCSLTNRRFTSVNDILTRLVEVGILSISSLPHTKTRLFTAHDALKAFDAMLEAIPERFCLNEAFRIQYLN